MNSLSLISALLTPPFSSVFFHPLLSSLLQALSEECESCGSSLAELGVAVQEFGEQNPLLCKQLGDAVAKLTEVQHHTSQQVQDRANRLKKVWGGGAVSSVCHPNDLFHIILLNIIILNVVFVLFALTLWSSVEQAERQVEEYQGMKAFILSWTKKAEALVTGNIIWSSASQLQEQIRAHQVSFNGAASRDCE